MIPELVAAVPRYLGQSFAEAAPGHRFQIYFNHWEAGKFTAYKGARLPDIKHLEKHEKDAIRKEFEKRKNRAVGDVCPLPNASKAQIQALRNRQHTLHKHHGSNAYRISTTSTAPFATGLGTVHPIENGFAFLTPYGLPYLAGSGVKGILRRAAEELALENETQDTNRWTWLAVWWLFGFEGAVDKGSLWDAESPVGHAFCRDLVQTATNPDLVPLIQLLFAGAREGARFLDVQQNGPEQFLRACMAGKNLRGGLQCRGALDFWDVFPSPTGDKLVVEIMTPHFGKYYQGSETPHDAGQPVPVSFLAVPAGSAFDFHVVCHPSRLPESLQNQWRSLLDQAFAHAFEWVGFGAKTSVGYGAMKPAAAEQVQAAATPQTQAAATAGTAVAADKPAAAAQQVWASATLTLNPGTGEIQASFEGKVAKGIKSVADPLRAALPEDQANKLKKKHTLKGVAVLVEPLGNSWQLKGLAAT